MQVCIIMSHWRSIARLLQKKAGLVAGMILLGLNYGPLAAKPVSNESQTENQSSIVGSEAESTGEQPADAKSKNEDEAIGEAWLGEIRKNPPSEAKNSTRLANPGQTADTRSASGENGVGIFTREEGPSFFSVVLRFLGLMALFLGGFYFLIRYLRRRGGGSLLGGGGDGLVKVLISVPLVQGKFLQVVDVAGRMMVLGVSEAGVQMLSAIDDGIAADRIRLWQSRKDVEPAPHGLLEALTSAIHGGDFRFWSNQKKKKRNSFDQILRQDAPPMTAATLATADLASTAPIMELDSEKKRAQQELFEDAPAGNLEEGSVEVQKSRTVDHSADQAALSRLLKNQKKRLAAMQNKHSTKSD